MAELRRSWSLPCLRSTPGAGALLVFLLTPLLAAPAHAATSAADLAVVDPTQRQLFDDLFLSARQPSFLRYLLPGRADQHLAWYPQQILMPLADNATPAAPLPGYAVDSGVIETPPATLGTAQGTGIAAAAQTPEGNACYLAQATTNDLGAYTVDLATSRLSNIGGAPFAAGGSPGGMTIEPSGRFLYVANEGGQSVAGYGINIATQALTAIGTTPTAAAHPQAISASRQCVFVASSTTGSGGYEVFAINAGTGALSSVPGSPFGTHTASSVARTPEGNFVYFSTASPAGEIEGFFVSPVSCALTPVPGSPFSGPAGGILRSNADLPVLYSAGSGMLQAFAIDPATGALSPLGAALPIDPDTGAMVVGPKGENLWLSDLSNHNLRAVSLDAVTGVPSGSGTPVSGPGNVNSMVLFSESGGQLIGRNVMVNRTQRILGGAPPYTVSLVGGALPAGLSFDSSTGAITGKPTTLGESTFELLITDAVGATSSSVRALKVVAPPAVPAAPSNLVATALSATEVKLTWQDNAAETAAFHIALSQDGGPFVEVQAARPQAASAFVNGLSPATSYTFRVRAENAAGGATDNTTATLTTPAAGPASCVASANGQCLLGGRFLLEAVYQDASGDAGLANVVPITTDTAYLWFFNSANVEAVVKVLDGCGLGGHYWVFAGGLTNVHVILRLTDTATGAVRYYEIPYGPAFTPIQDTMAFGTCSTVAAPGGAEPTAAAASSPAAANALRLSALADIGALLAASAPPPAARPAAPDIVPASCTPGPEALCLNNNRFRVSATFDAGAAGSGTAQVGQLTSDTGYLWFFSSSNVEAVVKVLNGCGLGGHYWVFAGGLTDVQVTLTVVDTATGMQRQYLNPANTTFEPIQDTSAFSTCP